MKDNGKLLGLSSERRVLRARALEIAGSLSPSSGISDSGLDLPVKGLEGSGVLPFIEASPSLEGLGGACEFNDARELSSRASNGARAEESRTRLQKCSYGRMTLVYEFLIWVERPGTPP